MELEKIKDLLAGSYADLQNAIAKEVARPDVKEYEAQYDPTKHEVTDTAKRPDKVVTTDEGTSRIPVARLSVPLQKRIVQMAVTFLCGKPIQLVANPKDANQIEFLAALQKTWDDNKLNYDTQELARLLFSETEVAEIWYVEKVDPGYWGEGAMKSSTLRMRMKIIANSLGDALYPVFNNAGDMVAFGRGYQITEDGQKVECYDLYTDDTTVLGKKVAGEWGITSGANVLGKIPVIYYKKTQSEWQDVQSLIDRFERLISNSADTNDYFGSPMVLVEGEVKGFAKKGESGKVLELQQGAKASYMSWDASPANVENEFKRLRSLILDMTDTPDISFENMKGLGTFSGIALKMMFLGAHMKASSNEQIFGKGVQRRINLMKAAIGKINTSFEPLTGMDIKPKFEYYIPEDMEAKIDTLMTANGNKPIISQKTAVRLNPLVTDPEAEILNLEEETENELPDNLNDE
jgi:SPP1 family phage portal protein